MKRPLCVGLILALASATVGAADTDRAAADDLSISGPYRHDNLTLFLLHGRDQLQGKDLLTLEEALEQQKVVVKETGNVNQLTVENVSGQDVFILAGDIVKGGRQDRVLGTDLLLRPNSGPLPIDSFCVEQGRWSPRGEEASDRFESSDNVLASRKLKLAARRARSQGEVWQEVAEVQDELQVAVAGPVRAADSVTSLQLTLEHPQIEAHTDSYIEALAKVIDRHDDAVGYAFAINGRLNSVDVFAAHALFEKLWPKLLHASAVEAVAGRHEKSKSKASIEDVEEALRVAKSDSVETRSVTDRLEALRKENESYVGFETLDRVDDLKLRLNLLRKDE